MIVMVSGINKTYFAGEPRVLVAADRIFDGTEVER